MTLIRHLTLDEYQTEITPKVMELKALLRKKFLYNRFYGSGFGFETADQYIQSELDDCKARMLELFAENNLSEPLPEREQSFLDEAMERAKQEALEKLDRNKIKPTAKMPEGHYDAAKAILDELEPRFTLPRIVDWSKAHKGNKEEVRYALDSNYYIKDLLQGTLSLERLEEICASVGVRIPKRIYNYSVETKERYVRKVAAKSNGDFLNEMDKALEPYTDELSEYMNNELKRIYDGYLKAGSPDVFTYGINHLEPDELRHLFTILDDGWDVASKKICEQYVSDLTLKFLIRLNEKLSEVNKSHGTPKINLSRLSFRAGTAEAEIIMTYEDGLKVVAETKLILAGGDAGYVQRLHYRYLSHFFVDGKAISQEQLDNL